MLDNLHLHARRLVIPHPRTGEKIDVSAPLPAHMKATWELLGLDEKRFEEG
jgi:23S rRNA pseudouridine955/2504/2580 synthase